MSPYLRPPLLTALAVTRAVAMDPDLLPETLITAERRLPGDSSIAAWSADDIAAFAPRTIDELLATEPSFSLYRRQTSLFGNPASAGVSLRDTGATAVSRTLVLRDGIPQNDPFGGWIHWARFDPATLASARGRMGKHEPGRNHPAHVARTDDQSLDPPPRRRQPRQLRVFQ